ncbi:MAG: HD domain-containing protein [Deltaproteobacteria bacterium]|jgi:3'-5' exoribonuclease|nr:HD domain-containing protein [Deltaproteobacteria bacterium]
MEKKVFISDIKTLKPGTTVTTPVIILDLESGRTVKGAAYLSLTLGDKSGTLKAKVWDDTEALGKILLPGTVRQVTGRVDNYRSQPQLSITGAVEISESDYDPADMAKGPAIAQERLKEHLGILVDSVEDKDFRALLKKILSLEETSAFFGAAAAKRMHHAYPGGLIEHSLSVAKVARLVAGHYGNALNRDLLVTGAILHDLGKCWEITGDRAPDYTTAGRLLGHLFMGAAFLEKAAASIPGFPEDKLLLLQHLLLCHHGQKDKGSPVTPKIIEGLVLHHLDHLDAQINALSSLITEQTEGKPLTWTDYSKMAESHFLSTPSWEEDKKPQDGPGMERPAFEPARKPSWASELESPAVFLDPREPRAPRAPVAADLGQSEAEEQFERVRKYFTHPEGDGPHRPPPDPEIWPEPARDGPREMEEEIERLRRSVKTAEPEMEPAQSELAQAELAQADLAQADLAQTDLAQSDLAPKQAAPKKLAPKDSSLEAAKPKRPTLF